MLDLQPVLELMLTVDLSEMVFQAAKLQKNAEAPQWASAFYPFEDDGFRS